MPHPSPSLHPGRHKREEVTESAGGGGNGGSGKFWVIALDLEG